MLLDVITLDVFWPKPLLTDQSGGIDTSLLQLNSTLQHTKPIVKDIIGRIQVGGDVVPSTIPSEIIQISH